MENSDNEDENDDAGNHTSCLKLARLLELRTNNLPPNDRIMVIVDSKKKRNDDVRAAGDVAELNRTRPATGFKRG